MDYVVARMGAEIAPYRSGLSLARLRSSDNFPDERYAIVPLPDHRDDGRARYVRDKLIIERLAFVLGIMLRGKLGGNLHHLKRDKLEPLVLKTRNDLTNKPPVKDSRLAHSKTSFCHSFPIILPINVFYKRIERTRSRLQNGARHEALLDLIDNVVGRARASRQPDASERKEFRWNLRLRLNQRGMGAPFRGDGEQPVRVRAASAADDEDSVSDGAEPLKRRLSFMRRWTD